MKSRKVRLAFTNNVRVLFTPRGGYQFSQLWPDSGQRGFIKVNGQTVSGYLGSANQFFASGINAPLVKRLIDEEVSRRERIVI